MKRRARRSAGAVGRTGRIELQVGRHVHSLRLNVLSLVAKSLYFRAGKLEIHLHRSASADSGRMAKLPVELGTASDPRLPEWSIQNVLKIHAVDVQCAFEAGACPCEVSDERTIRVAFG